MTFALSFPSAILSSDIDWASEACIADFYAFAEEHGIKPCLFVTHESKVVADLAANDKIEVGVHPNFLPGSTHGSDIQTVVDAVMQLAPKVLGFRSHNFMDGTPICNAFRKYGLVWDSNLCLYLQEGITPLKHSSGMTRIPVFWEDDVHMVNAPDLWEVDVMLGSVLAPGLKVLNVHPIHLALNTPNMEFFEAFRGKIGTLTAEEIAAHRFKGKGTRTFVADLISRMKRADIRFYTFEQVLGLHETSEAHSSAGRNDQLTAVDHERYWSMTLQQRQEMLQDMYNKRNPTDPYATSRDHNQRELEIDAIWKALPEDALKTVIDLGCGNGYTLLSLGKKLKSIKLIGVDFAENLIQGARVLAKDMAPELKSAPEYHCGDAIAFTKALADDSVDCLITERFLLNLPDEKVQQSQIREMFRVLRPGGRLLMCEGSMDGFRALNTLREGIGLPSIAETSAENLSSRRFDDKDIEAFVTNDLGFELIDKLGFSVFFAVSRALYPKLIAPQNPRFESHINTLARELQDNLPMTPGLGSNVLWVLRKPI